MRHLSLLFVFCLLTGVKLSAQTKTFQFGVRGGLSIVSLQRTLLPEVRVQDQDKSIAGLTAGIFTSFNINRFSVQPGLNFATRGGKTTEEILIGDIISSKYGKWRLNYLQLPVNLVYHIPLKGAQVFIGAGPYLSRALSGKFNSDLLDGQVTDDDRRQYYTLKAKFGNDASTNFKKYDYGINAIAGLQFKSGILVNAGYDLGLANQERTSYRYTYSSTRIRSFNISLGYLF